MPESVRSEIWEELGRAGTLMPVDPENALEIVEEARNQGEEWGEIGISAAARYYRAYIYRLLGREKESEICFRETEEMTPLITNQYDLARVMGCLGMEYNRRDEPARGLDYLRRGEEILHALGIRSLLKGNYHCQAIGYFKLGVFEEALEYNLRTLRLQEEFQTSKRSMILTVINIGSVYAKLHDYAKAEEYYHRAITMMRDGEVSDNHMLATCVINLGCLHSLNCRYREALPYLHEALELFMQVHDTIYVGEALAELGVANLHLDDLDAAAGYFQRAWELCEGAMITGVAPAVILQGMGQVHQRREEFGDALDHYLRSLAICQQMALPEEELEAHLLLAELYPLLGDYRNAYEHQKKGMEIRQQISSARQQRAAAAVELRDARLGAERERELLNLRAERAEYEAEFKTRELSLMTLQMTQWNAAFRSLRQSVEPYARDGRGQTKAVAASVLKDINAVVSSNSGWTVFEEQFERVYSEFLGRLHERSPRLTSTELRICVLIRMNLSTKQIADALFSSELTVKKHRANIRRKLDLQGDDNLNGLLFSL